MGTQALLTLACLFAAAETSADPAVPKSSSVADNESAESAPRLYRNVPLGVYASAAPHRAYSIQIPAFVSAQKQAASRIVPVTQVFQNSDYLKDSYGNRFVASPQSSAYKTTFPQQFVQLQELPSHLSQPIVAAAPSYHHRQPSPFAHGSHYTYPLQAASPQRFGIAQPLVYAGTYKTLAPFSQYHTPTRGTTQQQSTSNQVVYANEKSPDQFSKLKDTSQFQRLQEAPRDGRELTSQTQQASHHHDKAQLQAAPKETAIHTVVNGQKTVIHLKTNPPLPLLDLSLLEPLTFDNPLVPQVQHFLPRINQATYRKLPNPNINDAKSYEKEFMVMKTKSYDSGPIKTKSQNNTPKRKQERPIPESDIPHERDEPMNPNVKITGNPNGEPEISYEINSPNYKETYKEQAISYNKETQSDPVHYTYGSKTDNAPVTYSYAHNTKEPLKVKEMHYQGDGQGPTQLIYKFKPEEQTGEHDENAEQAPPQGNDHSEESTESENEGPVNYHPREHQDHHEQPKEETNTRPSKPEYREIQYHDIPSHGHQHSVHQGHHQDQPQLHHTNLPSIEPIRPETQYEEHIRIVPDHKTARIKVDPSQHVHKEQKTPQQQAHPSAAPQQHPHPSSVPTHHPQEHPAPPRSSYHPQEDTAAPPTSYHPPPQHIQEKSRRVIIQEETPEEMHLLREQISAEMIDQMENNEEDFEKAYKNAAFGFPAYHKNPVDVEKDIYNPESYGMLRQNSDYTVEHVPFQQYQEAGDDYPKMSRLNYKDARDKTKEDYYLDYSLSRPESLTDRYNNKVEYYKLYKKQRPEQHHGDEEKKKQNQNAKYTMAPFVFTAVHEKPKQTFAQYKAAPKYEYDYSKKGAKDSSAYASRPLHRYKSKTNFVEPQFQYGFEPISIPRLLDSELAAMASNHSPESEKPGLRKKLYKENWYIKQTSTTGAQPTS